MLSELFLNFFKLIEAMRWLLELDLLRVEESKSAWDEASMLRFGFNLFKEAFLYNLFASFGREYVLVRSLIGFVLSFGSFWESALFYI